MKRFLFAILAVLVLASPCFATTYYACGTANIDAASEWNEAQTCDGTAHTYGTGGFPASGATLDANSYTVTVNTDPGPNGTVTLIAPGTGGFAVATSTSPLTLHANIGDAAQNVPVLAITGSANANPALTIIGTILGGDTAAAYGVNDTHTVGTVVVTGNIKGGSNNTAHAYYLNGTGPATFSGTMTPGAAANSNAINVNAAAATTIAGACLGSDSYTGKGCQNGSTGIMTVTGDIYICEKQSGVSLGGTYWVPAANTNKIVYTASSSSTCGTINQYTVVAPPISDTDHSSWTGGLNLVDKSEIKSGEVAGPVTGTMSAGGGGGGSWGF